MAEPCPVEKDKSEDLEGLEKELTYGSRLKETIKWSNAELERTVLELEHDLSSVSSPSNKAASNPHSMHFNLDNLTEAELVRLVKNLERKRTDLYSTLRDQEWKLDKEGKEYHRLAHARSMYHAELRHYTCTLDRLRTQHIQNQIAALSRWN